MGNGKGPHEHQVHEFTISRLACRGALFQGRFVLGAGSLGTEEGPSPCWRPKASQAPTLGFLKLPAGTLLSACAPRLLQYQGLALVSSGLGIAEEPAPHPACHPKKSRRVAALKGEGPPQQNTVMTPPWSPVSHFPWDLDHRPGNRWGMKTSSSVPSWKRVPGAAARGITAGLLPHMTAATLLRLHFLIYKIQCASVCKAWSSVLGRLRCSSQKATWTSVSEEY